MEVLEAEGYKMFKGVMEVTCYTIDIKAKKRTSEKKYIEGTWLYKPDTECWYCNGSSYPDTICRIPMGEFVQEGVE